MKGSAFKDLAKIYVASGKGGDGASLFRREKYVPRGGPSGGDGGRGGHVFIQAHKDVDSLLPLTYTPHQKAEHGVNGMNKKMHGRNGRDLYIKVPCGTVIKDAETGEFLAEVVDDGETFRIARGGEGGLGNCHFMTSTHQAPEECTPGEPNEEKTLRLELKLVADVGLVGYPNAGKSTLISKISNAHPKVAAYPFTTLNPIIGTVQFDDYTSIRVADIPGLIDGAHEGTGLGHDFLRHIERTRFLVFIIDMAGIDGRKPWDDYVNLRKELRLYRMELDSRPYLIVANKMDMPDAWKNYTTFVEHTGERPVSMSALADEGVDVLRRALHEKVSVLLAELQSEPAKLVESEK